MPHPTSSSTIDTDRIDGLARELQRWLACVRATLADEIRSYPTPIPRCDAQFNHLVEQRDGVLYVNPGSAGPRRFRLPISVGELTIAGAAVSARTVEI